MNLNLFKIGLKYANNKVNFFQKKIKNYDGTMENLCNIIKEFFHDEEILQLLEIEYFQKLEVWDKKQIYDKIVSDNIKLKLFENIEFMKQLILFYDVLFEESEELRIKFLYNVELIKKYAVKKWKIRAIIESLSEKNILKILLDKDLILNKLDLDLEKDLILLMLFLKTDEFILQCADCYKNELDDMQLISLLTKVSDKTKEKLLIEDKYHLDLAEIAVLLAEFNPNNLVEFIKENKEFFQKRKIKIHGITGICDNDVQLVIVSRIEDMNLNLKEKLAILATLNEDVKSEIDTSKFPEEYIAALNQQVDNRGMVQVNLNEELERYSGLDYVLDVKTPLHMTKEEKEKLRRLGSVICPDISIKDDLNVGRSTYLEYITAEKTIDIWLEIVTEKWTDLQKIAYVDFLIGKSIRYSPDIDTEIFEERDARALWKIICKGDGVCNGITQVAKYMLDRVGIKAEIVNSDNHSYIKLRDIQWIDSNGEHKRGDTFLDPTWDLGAYKFGYEPNHFCLSYEEMRKVDIDISGNDSKSHEIEAELRLNTVSVDTLAVIRTFASIGLMDSKGRFPISKFMEASDSEDKLNNSPDSIVQRKLDILAMFYPEFAKHPRETMHIINIVSLAPNVDLFKKCVINRVYERKDEKKSPVIYVYVNMETGGKKFYVARQTDKRFQEFSQREFEEQFECYRKDLEIQDGHRPWEEISKVDVDIVQKQEVLPKKELPERDEI